MDAFTKLTAVAAPYDRDNVDTDQILPPRFLLKRRSDPLYPTYLFRDLRFDGEAPRADFVLNQAAYRDARIIVGGANFGGGSSREAAAIALQTFGIRCVIGVSFGDIFSSNCVKNGILPVRLPPDVVTSLRAQLHGSPGAALTVDLVDQYVVDVQSTSHPFRIDGFSKECLLAGLSQIDLTLRQRDRIDTFERRYRESFPWA